MVSIQNSLYFYYLVKPFRFQNRNLIKTKMLEIFKVHSLYPQRVNYIFCSDEYLLELNKKYLHHDYYTDVIAFPISDKPLVADVYISIERARENAKDFNVSFYHELLRLLIHSTLHLCGYRDKKRNEMEQMRNLESKYLSLFLS